MFSSFPAAFLVGASFLSFYVYLRRMLRHLDPSQAVPAHVRSALDTLAEGLRTIQESLLEYEVQGRPSVLPSQSDAHNQPPGFKTRKAS